MKYTFFGLGQLSETLHCKMPNDEKSCLLPTTEQNKGGTTKPY